MSSKRACTDAESQSRLAAFGHVAVRRFQALQALLLAVVVQVEADAARPDQAAAEAAAAQQGGQVEEVAADAAAVGGGRQEADVAGQGAQVAGVVGQPLQFQGDAAQHLGPDRDLAAGQRLDRLAVGRRVADRRVAGHRLHRVDRALVRPADQRPLDAAVLVAERDLQVEDLFAVALEAKMARLDDAGVDRADRHLVDLLALDAVEVRDADDRASRPASGPRHRGPGDTKRGSAPA